MFKLMAAIALIAVEFAAFRFIMDYDSDILVFVALSGLVLQFGIFLAIRSRNRARAFWTGFVAFGAAAAFSFYYGLEVDPAESTVAALWYEYLALVSEFTGITVLQSGFTISPSPPTAYEIIVSQAEISIIFTLPQLIIGLVGGLMGFALACFKQSCGRRSQRSTMVGLEHAVHPKWLPADCRAMNARSPAR